MKKLFFVLLLFLAFSVQNFATTPIVKVEVATLEKKDTNTVLDNDLDKKLSTGETKNTEENDENTDCETCCNNCYIFSMTCPFPCEIGFLAQYCQGGCCPHPPLWEFMMNLCDQACPQEV